MIAKRSLLGILMVLFAAAYPLSPAQGEEARIKDLHIDRARGNVAISFLVENCFNQKMEEAIKAGIPTTFSFFVKFYKRRLIKDKKLAAHRFRHRIVYDNLKDTFTIWLEEKDKEIEVQDLREAKRYMQRVAGFSVTRGQALREGTYELAIKAELDPVKLPLRLECILFFVSLWDFETDWYHYDVRVEYE